MSRRAATPRPLDLGHESLQLREPTADLALGQLEMSERRLHRRVVTVSHGA